MQTKIQSWIEQFCNVGSGFLISLIYWQVAIIPQVQNMDYTSMGGASWITVQFTIISVIRGYLWRRYFNQFVARRYLQTKEIS